MGRKGIPTLFLGFLIIGLFVVNIPPASADSSSTGWTSMKKDPLKKVKVKCDLTITENNKISQKCQFKNEDTVGHRFIFCSMIDLASSSDHQPVSGLNQKHYKLKQVPPGSGNWKCVEETGKVGHQNSYHFGCKVVDIPAGGERHIDFGSGDYKMPSGETYDTDDFEVRYADAVILPLGGSGDFDEASCRAPMGQGNYLVPIPTDVAAWFMSHQPFDDPYLLTQDISMNLGSIFYATFADMRCITPDFPITVDELPKCPVHEGTPPPNTIDINLFYWLTEYADEEAKFPGVLSVETEGDMSGIRIQTSPEEGEIFQMPGGGMLFGNLTLCSSETTETCEPPAVEEGRTVYVSVDVLDPETNEFLFNQDGRFTKDTKPPEVDSHSVSFEGDKMRIEIAATDKTTSPIYSSFWYSIDGGESWNRITLEPTTSILEEDKTRTFTAVMNSPQPGTDIKYFMTVHDTVFNVNYFGPSETKVPGGCLIATAAFGSELSPQVQLLRETRDNVLLNTQSGAVFMAAFNEFYYSFSPTVAEWERQNPAFKEFVKITITPLISTLSILNYVDINSEQELLGYGIGIILLNVGMYFILPVIVILKIKSRFTPSHF